MANSANLLFTFAFIFTIVTYEVFKCWSALCDWCQQQPFPYLSLLHPVFRVHTSDALAICTTFYISKWLFTEFLHYLIYCFLTMKYEVLHTITQSDWNEPTINPPVHACMTPIKKQELFLFPLTLGEPYALLWMIGYQATLLLKLSGDNLHLCPCRCGALPWGAHRDKLSLIHRSVAAHVKHRGTVFSLGPLGSPATSPHQSSQWMWSHPV